MGAGGLRFEPTPRARDVWSTHELQSTSAWPVVERRGDAGRRSRRGRRPTAYSLSAACTAMHRDLLVVVQLQGDPRGAAVERTAAHHVPGQVVRRR